MNVTGLLESQRVRAEIRAGRITGTSRGLAHGFVQTNLAILPKDYALDFLLYCAVSYTHLTLPTKRIV